MKGSGLLFYTFVAVLVYLTFAHPKASIGLTQTLFTGYARSVKALQGR